MRKQCSPISYLQSPISQDHSGTSTTRISSSSLLIREIRTCAPNARAANPAVENEKTARLVARVLRALLQAETFPDQGSVREALKCRCAQLRIRGAGPTGYGDLVDRALVLVGSNVALTRANARPAVNRP